MIATGVAAFSAFLLVGKLPSQGTAGTDLPSFKQIASLGPSAPVIPEVETRARAPVAAPVAVAPAAKSPVKPAARATSKVQDRPRSVAAPSATPDIDRTKAAALPPRPAEPDTHAAYSVQLAAHPPSVQPVMPAPQTAASGKGNRIAATTAATPTPQKPQAAAKPAAAKPVAARRAAAPPVVVRPAAPPPPVVENTAPAQPPAPKLDAEELATLMKRSEEFIGAGDFASARIVLRRAAESGHAGAALALAGTYDPAVLERFGVTGMIPDPAKAKFWYEKARELGSGEAPQLLERLASRQN